MKSSFFISVTKFYIYLILNKAPIVLFAFYFAYQLSIHHPSREYGF